MALIASQMQKITLTLKCRNVKKAGKQPTASISTIYKQTLVEFQDSGVDIICKISAFKSVKSTLYSKRNKAVGTQKPCFKNVEEIIGPPVPIIYFSWQITIATTCVF